MNDNINKKNNSFKNILQNIYANVQNNASKSIIAYQNYVVFIEKFNLLIKLINNSENSIADLQKINDSISQLLKSYGSTNFLDIITVCFDNDYLNNHNFNKDKFELIIKYCKPFNYSILKWNNNKNNKNYKNEIQKNKIIEDKSIIEDTNNFECFDLMRTYNNFIIRIYGIKIVLHDYKYKKTLTINCLIDSVAIELVNNIYLTEKLNKIQKYYIENNIDSSNNYIWENYKQILTIKEILIYNDKEIYNKFIGILYSLSQFNNISIAENIESFNNNDIFNQRNILINLLLDDLNIEYKYIANALYDLILGNNNYIILNTLPIFSKTKFLFTIDITKKTIENISQSNNSISLEQQIILMNTNDKVKDRAMQKLREVRSKSEESGSKAKYYLDGLLKIPFGIFKVEEIFTNVDKIKENYNTILNNSRFDNILNYYDNNINNIIQQLKNSYNGEYYNIINNIKLYIDNNIFNKLLITQIHKQILSYTRNQLINILKYLYNNIDNKSIIICENKKDINKLKIDQIRNFIYEYTNLFLYSNILTHTNNTLFQLIEHNTTIKNDKEICNLYNIRKNLYNIDLYKNQVTDYIKNVNIKLEKSIYGHKRAKNYIEKILGQWITGKQTGVCFGFEGPPGVGKTSLAKYGISQCLIDNNGISRPFSFIAIGGSNNGSIIDGHSYTYLGSTWGKIVDILMTSKCMNPIIFIDEIDKVSKTENGKEILSIFTHLTDSTQNSHFQDKYFSNIDLDLSKVIFIFSYNDVENIDKILLDRIHRIKFDHLTLMDKLTIVKDYILPEILKKCGLNKCIYMNDDTIIYIINNYTNESGVRKLKEIIYDVISTINIDIIKYNKYTDLEISITTDTVKTILSDYPYINHTKVLDMPIVGIVNGMWANQLGNGGILYIETSFFLTNTFFELKLTGMQGDVMRESMNVAKTLAWSLLDVSNQEYLIKHFEVTKMQGIHIHVPEGATPKDGPSAGIAITLAIYSLLSKIEISNTYAFTGEISLQGNISKIGGLDLKIIGAIRAGVKNIVYPRENNHEYKQFLEKYQDIYYDIKTINFIEISNIHEVIKLLI